MNENFNLDEHGEIYCERISLLKKYDLSLNLVFQRVNNKHPRLGKKFLLDVQLYHLDNKVTSDYTEAVLLKESLLHFGKNLFTEVDENEYFTYSIQTVNKVKRTSLLCKFASKKLYLGKVEAKTMVSIWNQAMFGYSFQKLLERKATKSIKVVEGEMKALHKSQNIICNVPTTSEVLLMNASDIDDLLKEK